MPARGRPLGEVSKIVLLELGRQPRGVHQVAVDLHAHERMMVAACSKLKAAGRLQVVGVCRASRSSRPVAVLALKEQPTEDAVDGPAWMR